MKTLIRSAKPALNAAEKENQLKISFEAQPEEAQCCAKVSKTVAGCHD